MSEPRRQPAYPLRMPQELRKQLEDSANENKRSLNAELIARLEESLFPYVDADKPLLVKEFPADDSSFERTYTVTAPREWEKEKLELVTALSASEHSYSALLSLIEILDFDNGNHIRFKRPTSTYAARDQLLACLDALKPVDSVLLAVRDGDYNYSALSTIISGQGLVLLSDSSLLTTERPPRESEVRSLIQKLNEKNLLNGQTMFRPKRMTKQTNELPIVEAIHALEDSPYKPLTPETLQEFLKLFHADDSYERTQEELNEFLMDKWA